jgi:hypothetical protein
VSTITKGKHMIPVLNEIGTHVACMGNHGERAHGIGVANLTREHAAFRMISAAQQWAKACGRGAGHAMLHKTVHGQARIRAPSGPRTTAQHARP